MNAHADQLERVYRADGFLAEAEGPSSHMTPMLLVLGTTTPFGTFRHGKAIQVEEVDAQSGEVASSTFKVFLLPQVGRPRSLGLSV